MKNTRWIAVAIVAFVVLGGLYWWQGSRGDMTAADCTSYEQYDEQNGECYFPTAPRTALMIRSCVASSR